MGIGIVVFVSNVRYWVNWNKGFWELQKTPVHPFDYITANDIANRICKARPKFGPFLIENKKWAWLK